MRRSRLILLAGLALLLLALAGLWQWRVHEADGSAALARGLAAKASRPRPPVSQPVPGRRRATMTPRSAPLTMRCISPRVRPGPGSISAGSA